MILTEAAVRQDLEQGSIPARLGFEWGIPAGGANINNTRGFTNTRTELMEQLHDSYMACEPTSDCVDVTARSVTSGGLVLVPDGDIPEGKTPSEPPNVQAMRKLMRFTNPREDLVQVLRGVVSDLEIFGDAYLEVSLVLGQPVALYSLDSASMSVLADEHGVVTGYRQYIDMKRSVTLKPEQIIHFSQDAPRGGLYGVGPVQKSLISVTAWLSTAACIVELMRRGDPPRIHADLPRGMPEQAQSRWYESYMTKNLGIKNIGTPIITSGGGHIEEMAHSKVTDYLETLRQLRDDIFQVHGVPPNKGGVVESGNLGGGTGEAQDKTWRVNKIIPIQSIVLEKLNYSLVQVGFGITGWHLEFEEIDFRDSQVVESIRDNRVRTGQYTINRARAEIGEPPVPGGDDPLVMLSRSIVFVKDIGNYTQAMMNQMNAPLIAAGDDVDLQTGLMGADSVHQPLVGLAPTGEPRPKTPTTVVMPVPPDAADKPDPQGIPPHEVEMQKLRESLAKAYQTRRRRVLKGLPDAKPE